MGFFKRHRTAIASTAVLVLGASALVTFALSSTGYPVRQADLHDGGIWVTSDADGLVGRLNKPVGSLDAAFYPPGGAQTSYQLDVLQDGAAVVARDLATGRALPVDVGLARALPDGAVPVGADVRLRLGGGTLAALDPASGKVWATRVDERAGTTDLSGIDPAGPAVATLDGGGTAALAVGVDGAVHAVSASGKTVTVRVGDSGFEPADYGQLSGKPRAAQATAVGELMVVLDTGDGTLYLPDGSTRALGADADARLQQPSQSAATALVATSRGLFAVGMGDGAITALHEGAAGAPAAPVRLGDCVYAAWAKSTPGYVRACGGGKATPGNLRDEAALVKPQFRVNRQAVVLNDLATGAVWDLGTQQKVDDWSAVKPPPIESDSDKSKDDKNTDAARDKPPKAVDDTLGARPGRTTVLHVLDNDSDPAGNTLSITALSATQVAGSQLSVAPDGQTVQVTMPPGGQSASFKYTVDDGRGLTATATVSVQARAEAENKPPEPRLAYQPRDWSVPAGGNLVMPALADWRDFDGDPIVLADAAAEAGSVTTTPDGFVEYTAPAEPGRQPVRFRVTDGRSEPVGGTENVVVQDPAAGAAVAPTAEPDVARGQVGKPIVVRPLENDRPGADPTDPLAQLALAAEVATPPGTTVLSDLKTGTVTVTATKPGTTFLEYTASYGNAPFAKGSIRVDAAPAPPSPLPPVAVPDSAVVRGQLPTLVDVLANDFDPAGDLLVVQRAETTTDAQLQVAVVRGRWLRINAVTPALLPNPQVVRYSITSGATGEVTGEVQVTQLAPPADDTPVPKDDHATVRAGDAVTIPVLDNDTSPSGAPIVLQANVQGAPGPGMLSVTGVQDPDTQVGTAYTNGGTVRYVPPAAVDAPTKVTVKYVAQNASGSPAFGYAHITITPAPSPTNPDQAPTPQPVEARATAGDTLEISLPTSGVDPDGDSVTVTGIGSAPALGRVLAVGATSVTYQAYPTTAGTDSFKYVVTDPYGKSAESVVRVGVVPPGDPQPAVAVDDVVTAAPGSRVAVSVLDNDVRAPGDTLVVEPLDKRNPVLPPEVELDEQTGVVELTAPEATGKPLVVVYAIAGGLGDPSLATLTLRAQEDYNAPPVVADTYAQPPPPGSGTVAVNVLDHAGDVDGPSDKLTVTSTSDPRAVVSGGELTVPVTDQPRTVAYEVTDAGGAKAVGFLHVPATGNGAPYAKAGQSIEVDVDGSTTVDLAEYVVDPAGKPVKLTLVDRIATSPAAGLRAAADGEAKLVLTGLAGYNGPAAVTFQVTNGASLADGQTAYISVPVQVGPEVPVLRCPSGAITLTAGGTSAGIDVTSVCHVWTAKAETARDLRYSGAWKADPGDVDIDGNGSRRLRLTAAGAARPGATGVLEVTVDGTDAAPAALPVVVAAAPPPSVAPVIQDGIKAGDTAEVSMVAYVRSRLRDPEVGVVSVRQVAGMAATTSVAGSLVRLTPGADAHGQMAFDVVVTDVPDRSRTDRQVTGRITLNVLGVPDAPGTPVPGRTTLSKVVELSWPTPASNGAPIEGYEVEYDGGSQACAASPCTITGLTNGRDYSFAVKARNLVGWSPLSGRSAAAQPNTVPGAVGAITASDPQDHSLRLSWSAPPNEGTAVQRYEIAWTGGGRSTAQGTSATITGLDNDTVYTFTIVAVNAQGPGPANTGRGQSAGAPAAPGAPTATTSLIAGGSRTAVVLDWAAVGSNGPGPTTYTVNRDGRAICTDTSATTCADDGVANDGTVYSYTVTAKNSVGHTSPPSPPAQVEASAQPDPVSDIRVTATGRDNTADLYFDVPPSRGKTNTVKCTVNGGGSCGTWTYGRDGAQNAYYAITVPTNGTEYTVTLQNCNGSTGPNACNQATSGAFTTYGNMKDLTVSASPNGQSVNYSVSVDPNGKPATVRVQSSAGRDESFTTCACGVWSQSFTDNVGYSYTDTITVTVSDAGRPTLTKQAQARTQDPPPPPPSVEVAKGNPCNGNCAGCTDVSCAFIFVTTKNFTGGVTCTFNSDHGNGGFVNQNYGPNEARQSQNYYGYPGERVYVTCGGVQGSALW
ncbi:Ig-like domain-containing protein [Actinokineospora bangkokensis]|uniref:Fibronectin type-III domain-containing protein n=1 Tax=Actinokineospora bangkokensis TaxID=1193682 RepID=A0A1Q9LCP3_9PSEU|nr:Ig-like domain-containing protein [Actinokineospora bangkokensis]OLR89800.1 hypothetical protein BJP25_01900 [Actinokineospora bangkokensis]